MCQRLTSFVTVFALLCGAAAMPVRSARAEANGPVYKDAERFAEPGYDAQAAGAPPYGEPRPIHPPRRVTGGPGYAGSEYGLGKPSFFGLGSRPDWGRSNQ